MAAIEKIYRTCDILSKEYVKGESVFYDVNFHTVRPYKFYRMDKDGHSELLIEFKLKWILLRFCDAVARRTVGTEFLNWGILGDELNEYGVNVKISAYTFLKFFAPEDIKREIREYKARFLSECDDLFTDIVIHTAKCRGWWTPEIAAE